MDKQWELHKEEIVSLYRERTAQEVRDHMQQAYSFDATPQQYERRLKKWGVRKNLKAEEWMVIGRRIAKRKAEDDKESELRVDGYPFPPRKVLKATSRYQEGTIEKFRREQRPFRSPTPEGCQLFTPVVSRASSPSLSRVFSLNLDKSPLLQFQRFMGRKFVVFQDLLSHLDKDQTGYEVVTRPTTELSQSVQHNTLVLQAVYESSFTLSPSANTQKALGEFFEAVFRTTNHILDNGKSRNKTLRKLAMGILPRMIKTPQNKALLLHAISEQNPTFDALIEITFRTALLKNRGDLVRFLIESAKVNPNDTVAVTGRSYFPMEIAILKHNFTMAELLIDLGADPRKSFSNHYEGSLLDYLVKTTTPEFLRKILVKWCANTLEAPTVFRKHEQCREFVRKSLREAVNLRQVQTASIRNTPEDSKFALSALKAAIFANDFQTAGRIITSFKDRELEVMNETEDGLVFYAVEVGSMDMVRLLLKSGADVNVPGPLSMSPLTIAILHGELDITKLLIDWGASIERCSSTTDTAPTPLQAATFKGFYEIASILISRGANVKAAPSTILNLDDQRFSRIHFALEAMYESSALKIAVFYPQINRLELVQLLVENGADFDACLDNTIHSMALYGSVRTTDAVFRYLLTVCSSFSIGDALYTVIELGFMQSLRFLSETFYPHVSSSTKCTDPEFQVEMVSHLIHHGVELIHSDNKPMRFSGDLYKDNPSLAELLLQNGAYISVFKELEDSLFPYDEGAVKRALETLFSAPPHPTLLQDPCFGHSTLVSLSGPPFRRFDIVRSLIEWGVRVDSPGAVSTVVQICSHGTVEDLRMLLSSGAPVNGQRDFECDCWDRQFWPEELIGFSPLQVAAKYGRADMVEVLLQAGAWVNYRFMTGLELSCESTLSISVEGGLRIVEMVLNAGADVNEPPHELGGRTALQKAAQVGDIEVVRYLLQERQADVNAGPAEWRGVTALQAAAIHSHFDIVHMLLEMGADPNAPGAEEDGRTALEGAAERGRIDMIQLLLDNGADVTSANFGTIQLGNAVRLARQEGFHAAARMLERHRDELGSKQ